MEEWNIGIMGKKGRSLGWMISDLLAQALAEDKLRKSEFNIPVNVKPGQCLLPEGEI
jgi:hypothetical protein